MGGNTALSTKRTQMTTTTATINFVNEFAPGFYEVVDRIDTNPRPSNHEGVWENGITTYKYVGRRSGLLAIQERQIGGFERWFSPDGVELCWPHPQFDNLRHYKEALERDQVYGLVA